jgi:hypothetical protein
LHRTTARWRVDLDCVLGDDEEEEVKHKTKRVCVTVTFRGHIDVSERDYETLKDGAVVDALRSRLAVDRSAEPRRRSGGIVTPASYWKQVREACDKATPGPWHTVDEQGTPWNIDSADGDSVAMSHQLVGDRNHAMRKANAEFIALSRTALPLALARIEELEAALRDTYGKVKYAFAYVDADGRRTSEDISPTAQARIKGVLREHIAAAIGDGCIPGCLCMQCKP